MKRRYIITTFIICQSIFCWLAAATATAQPLTSRAATASSYRERGNAWFAKGEYERAIAGYDLAIASDPNQAGNYHNRAVAWFYLKDYERARADFTRALELNPRLTEAYVARGGVRYALGDPDGAISDSTTPKPTTIVAWRASSWAITMAQSATTRGRSDSNQISPKPGMIAARRAAAKAIFRARSPISTALPS